MDLPFRIENHPSRPGRIKIRNDGRQGPLVGDEELLWDALMFWQARVRQLEEELRFADKAAGNKAEEPRKEPTKEKRR